MADMSLEKARIHAGIWEGVLTAPVDVAPELEVMHQAQAVPGVEVAALADQSGQFSVRVPIPAELLGDGVQTFVIQDKSTGQTLDSFVIVTGEPLQADIRAEMDLLRSELDMLKRAFRRHCQAGDDA
ncbi:hypothetical protein ALP8811_00051 [Aliiroseovarius pelagivivens]|uniref:Uncharacterized protein n=1 Tax=Aliiroseovarius pelagivivens TaxID=1639690 RepID=A0A2R8AGR3_9RHOB|nr:hypothetical protein [Aliiroseovarius pelagivivens]SPF75067.1 hypothetical protein ALP8811_00051 [Aliiroseovarius pelagivivens]